MITFIWPLAFLLLPLPLVVRYLASAKDQGTSGAIRVPFFAALMSEQGDRTPRRFSFSWPYLGMLLVWCLLVSAMARPAYVGPEVALPVEGRDLMMAIDLSGSMAQEDFIVNGRAQTRMQVVKDQANAFLERREGDRVGMIFFSDRAFLQAPLTYDRAVVGDLLAEAEVGLTGQQTAIGDAIAIASKRLRDRPESSRVLVLLTDGENNAGIMTPIKAAELAKKLGIRIYTIGVGADSMLVNSFFGQQRVNPSQELDESTLTQVAELTGGRYFRAKDAQGLNQVYQAIDALEPTAADPVYVRPEVSLYFYPAGFALALAGLIALLVLIQTTVKSWNLNRGEIS